MKIAYYSHAKKEDALVEGVTIVPAELFCILLERMELSKGFLNLEKKTYRPHTSRTTLLPSFEIVRMIAQTKQGLHIEVQNQLLANKM